ncbi:vigilin [Nephila pilipes]|uniref:Vigilin n=1 Tax=Nephila pilipes TaxID=299642 RepID=A0A8X6N2N5_NEPPI|nr:vigilin [Nephila pilipes]
MDASSWLHKYIIGKKGANIKHMTQDLSKAQVKAFNTEIPIYKQNHKFIFGKGGANIKKISDETNTKTDLLVEGAEADVIEICGPKEDVMKIKKRHLEISNEKQLNGHTAGIKAYSEPHKFLIVLKESKDFLEPADQRFHEIVVIVTVECLIPKEHHRTVLDTTGSKVQNVRRQFNVTIKLPDREKPEDVD